MTIGANIHLDSNLEWRALASFTDPSNYSTLEKIKPALFTNERQKLFLDMRAALQVYGAITPDTMPSYPTELDVPYGTNMEAIVDRLKTVAIRRQLVEKAHRLEALANDSVPDLDTVQKELEFIPLVSDEDSSLLDASVSFLAELQRKKNQNYDFITTGYLSLDAMLMGEWPRRAVTLIGALPGTGKTALAFDSMIRVATLGIPQGMINLEMSKTRVFSRGVANLADVSGNKIRIGDLDEEETARVNWATNRLNELPIKMIAARNLDVSQIIGHMRDMASHGVKVVFIDHLQLINCHSDDLNNALGQVTWALNLAADKYDMSVILLTQLTEKNGRYVVRNSGEVESKADTFLTLAASGNNDHIRTITVTFIKNRDGELGEFPMHFYTPYQRFTDVQSGERKYQYTGALH